LLKHIQKVQNLNNSLLNILIKKLIYFIKSLKEGSL
jgi:hypothetical protein